MDTDKKFSSAQAEILHWRELAQSLKAELEDVKEESEEYRISSQELEAELEAQLVSVEEKNKELVAVTTKLGQENEAVRAKLNEMQTTTHRELSEMEVDLAQVRAYNEELQRYIRELEQSNDDLERGKRATVASLEEFEINLNRAIERNAFLESELDEKDTLMETVQRLKDEARDMRQEMNVKRRTIKSDNLDTYNLSLDTNNSNCNTPSSTTKVKPIQVVTAVTDPHKLLKQDCGVIKTESSVMRSDNGIICDQGATPLSRLSSPTMITPHSRGSSHSTFGSPMAPSARISALNIVGDLLRKVGALESKLASCRNYSKEPPPFGRHASDSPQLNSPRTKRRHLNRGASMPQGPAPKIPV